MKKEKKVTHQDLLEVLDILSKDKFLKRLSHECETYKFAFTIKTDKQRERWLKNNKK